MTETTRPSDVNVPIRTCIGCSERRPQAQLIRCVLLADGSIRTYRSGSGRGAWLCGLACFDQARKRRAFDRAWHSTVSAEAIDQLKIELAALNESTN